MSRFEHGEYVVNDAVDHLGTVRDEAALCVFDDPWARPKRGDAFGVEYPTHSFHRTGVILHQIEQALTDGGWLIADADDWVLPKLIDRISKRWGNVAETYEGGGYRKTGRVTLVSSDGTPDRSTPGESSFYRRSALSVDESADRSAGVASGTSRDERSDSCGVRPVPRVHSFSPRRPAPYQYDTT